ncbi:MAG: Ig-like domain-containing protein [Actinomycetes bacterium]
MTCRTPTRRVHEFVALVLAAAVLAACSSSSSATQSAKDAGTRQSAADPTAALVLSDGRRTLAAGDQVAPGTRLGVGVYRGRLVKAQVADSTGRALDPEKPLPPKNSFTVTAEVQDAAGERTVTRTVKTRKAKRTIDAYVTPSSGSTVGVGMPIIVDFSQSVRNKKAAERALSVSTSRPVGPASWSWLSDTQVQYRPKDYWPANTQVTVQADLADVRTDKRTWGDEDTTTEFRVGREQVLKIRNATHSLRVIKDGQVIRRMGVSMGKPGYTSRSGIKVIMTHERWRRMRSTTVNIGGGESYDLNVPYSMRITNTGEFLHGAPWNPLVGQANVSHGCTNLDLSQAAWLFSHSVAGDPVETRGTGKPMESYNGWGGGWNLSWASWVGGSALS